MADIQSLLGDEYREGMTVEEINAVLANREFVDPTTLPKSVDKSTFDKTASELAKVKKERDELKQNNMTSEEKVNAAIAAADARANEYAVKLNRLEVERLFMADGLVEDDYAAVIDDIVSEDTEKTMKLAKNMLAVVKAQKSAAEKAVRAELLKKTPKPPAGNDGKPEGMTLAEFRKLSPTERHEWSVNHPEEYQNLYNGGNN